jgi:hypothetical protein
MHSIGSERDAQTILEWVSSHRERYDAPTCTYSETAPEGWKYLGKGSFRSVWLSPEGVAYKVSHSVEGWCSQQEEELVNLTRAWGRAPLDGCRLPQFHGYEVSGEIVVAIEAINGVRLWDYKGADRGALYDLMDAIEKEYRLIDMHDENVMVDESGYLVPVDFGS